MTMRPNKYKAKSVFVCASCDAWHGEDFLKWDNRCQACGFVEGIRFASRAEAARYGHLRTIERAGQITELKLQPRFPVEIRGRHIFTYIADFEYVEAGQRHVEDVKGRATAVFRIKQKAVEAYYPYIKIEIVRVSA